MRRALRFLHGCLLGVAAALATALCAPAIAQNPTASEAEVKIAFVLNFARFAEWPGDSALQASNTFTICFLGRDRLGSTPNALEERSIGSKPVVVKRNTSVEDAKACHVLYIDALEAARLPSAAQALKTYPVLIITDAEGAGATSMITLVRNDTRLEFEVNLTALRAAKLRLGASVLKLARNVY